MRDFKLMLEKYAKTVIKCGVNLQKGEYLVVNSDINNAELARELAKAAYAQGAKRVIVNWSDEELSKVNYQNATKDALTDILNWEIEQRNSIAEIRACYVNINSSDPDLFKNIDSEKVAAVRRKMRKACDKFYDDSEGNAFKWCIIGGASYSWAKKIFPNDENCVEKLWDLIFKANRIDTNDPQKAWEEHGKALHSRCDKLNSLNLDCLVYKNSLGTDLTVKLPDGYIFAGGSETSKYNCEFTANMPTEEVFTTPHKYGVNGKLVASIPLSSSGRIIKDFGFTFENGKVVDFYAKEGYDTLKAILENDEASKYLGEVALISFDSPINNTKTLFYSTLFDENASCHFALGAAYPTTVKGGEQMTDEQKDKCGINVSNTHVDFMVGTRDLSIVGITKSGEKVDIMLDGNLVF